jgi:Coenzyme PQQ synthesis protein D (PqqD)
LASRRLKPVRKLPGRAVANERVVVDPRTRRLFVMNKVGAMVWEGVEREASAAEIVAGVVARFRVDEARASADVTRFLDELEAAGLAVPPEAESRG